MWYRTLHCSSNITALLGPYTSSGERIKTWKNSVPHVSSYWACHKLILYWNQHKWEKSEQCSQIIAGNWNAVFCSCCGVRLCPAVVFAASCSVLFHSPHDLRAEPQPARFRAALQRSVLVSCSECPSRCYTELPLYIVGRPHSLCNQAVCVCVLPGSQAMWLCNSSLHLFSNLLLGSLSHKAASHPCRLLKRGFEELIF